MIEEEKESLNSSVLAQFAEVILPVRVPLLYTYRIPESLKGLVVRGSRVIVQFGKKRILTAVVSKVHATPPTIYEAKPILDLLDSTPLINTYQFQLFQFIASYYLCTLGEVLNAALPAGLKLNSESKIQLNPAFDFENLSTGLTDLEANIINACKSTVAHTYEELAQLVNVKNINQAIKSLIAHGMILLFEEVREKYTPKVVKKVKLTAPYLSGASLSEVFDKLEKNAAQLEILQKYLHLSGLLQDFEKNNKGIERSVLLENVASPSPLNSLLKKNIFEEFSIITPRFEVAERLDYQQELSPLQRDAANQIEQHFATKDVVLLHGITGSGKTEIYIELIQKALAGQSQVLFMVPEIALTTQLVNRLQKAFGKKLGVYHSKFSDNERVEVWSGLAEERLSIIVGVRSSIFLPFDNLGLIIIDEEHETSYKQSEPAPRYHGRDTALMLARLHHAKVLLGSATPSVESYYLATQQQWGLVNLHQRFGGAVLPKIEAVDLRLERRNKTLKLDFSKQLLEGMKSRLARNEQTIIFQNRRGYSPLLICEECGFTPQCDHCAVSLTYHMYKQSLTCHYCGYTEAVIKECPACGSTKIKSQGVGTEKLEDDLKLLVPEARIQRMDLETTRNKNSFAKIIEALETGQVDILVGTQMVSKGFDFENVSLVGVIDFDRMLHFPDFRSAERTFQMISQVAGRAGRRMQQGEVLVQTNKTDHWVLSKIINHDYIGFYNIEIAERAKFNYPPFSRIIKITIKNTQVTRAEDGAKELFDFLSTSLGAERVLGPEAPGISRIRNYFLFDIYLKIERNKIDLVKVKAFVAQQIQQLLLQKKHQSCIIVADVDPI